jgi:CRP/FNR family transcriptional regulator, cyclic AMP receptor protein
MNSNTNDVLRRTPLFASLSPPELNALASLALERHFDPGETLFHEGDPCTGFVVLGLGSVRIVKTSPSGREIMLAVESAPSSVAEVPLFDGGPYPATVTAIDDVAAVVIGKQDFRQVCHQHPEVALKVLSVAGQRLRQLVGVVEAVSFGSVRQRLARTLLEYGQTAVQGSFLLPATHQEIASRLGTVREVVSRNLSRFQSEGLIRIQKRQVTLIDPAGLEREAEMEF